MYSYFLSEELTPAADNDEPGFMDMSFNSSLSSITYDPPENINDEKEFLRINRLCSPYLNAARSTLNQHNVVRNQCSYQMQA